MNHLEILEKPDVYAQIERQSSEIGFHMTSDLQLGNFLKTMVASKPGSRILELGTGTGLSLSWMVDGMDAGSRIISIDNDPMVSSIATKHFGMDPRVKLICADGSQWINEYDGPKFDLIFADAWPGKYSELEETLALLEVGGFYIVDDMLPQTNWPKGHDAKATALIANLENRTDLSLTKMNWSTGIIIGVKKN